MNELALAIHSLVNSPSASHPSAAPNLSARQRAALEDLRSLLQSSSRLADVLGKGILSIDWYAPPSVAAESKSA